MWAKLTLWLKYSNLRTKSLSRFLSGYGFSGDKLAVLGLLTLLAVILVFNIYAKLAEVPQNYAVMTAENDRLQKAREKKLELEQEIEYYSSLEYRRRYGYDSMNFAREGESIYLINPEGRSFVELEEHQPDPILRADNKIWWDIFWQEVGRGLQG